MTCKPSTAWAWFCGKGENLEGAIAQYQKALELKPDDAQARNNLGNALEMKGDMQGAIAQYRKVLEINPISESAHNNIGNVLEPARRYGGSRRAISQGAGDQA